MLTVTIKINKERRDRDEQDIRNTSSLRSKIERDSHLIQLDSLDQLVTENDRFISPHSL